MSEQQSQIDRYRAMEHAPPMSRGKKVAIGVAVGVVLLVLILLFAAGGAGFGGGGGGGAVVNPRAKRPQYKPGDPTPETDTCKLDGDPEVWTGSVDSRGIFLTRRGLVSEPAAAHAVDVRWLVDAIKTAPPPTRPGSPEYWDAQETYHHEFTANVAAWLCENLPPNSDLVLDVSRAPQWLVEYLIDEYDNIIKAQYQDPVDEIHQTRLRFTLNR